MLYIKIKDLRSLQSVNLKDKLKELRLELASEKRKVASTGVASKVVKTKDIKHTIARIKTILNERGVTE
ncbi:MAG: 50S ribosomal protein L29 [Candidatus Marsarchaeota archaeon]|nr:50S ribosomal protein L29 [Candidatus Marsarchaeota archaeon]